MMTPEQKIEALRDLLFTVIHALEMKQYEIEDPTESHNCVIQADEYHDQMLKILHDEDACS